MNNEETFDQTKQTPVKVKSRKRPKRRAVTRYNYDPNALGGEVNILPSKAVPNDVLPLAELLRRHGSGQFIPINNAEYLEYDSEMRQGFADIGVDIDDIHKMDRAERMQALKDVATKTQLVRKQIIDRVKHEEEMLKKEAEKAEQAEIVEAEIVEEGK